MKASKTSHVVNVHVGNHKKTFFAKFAVRHKPGLFGSIFVINSVGRREHPETNVVYGKIILSLADFCIHASCNCKSEVEHALRAVSFHGNKGSANLFQTIKK